MITFIARHKLILAGILAAGLWSALGLPSFAGEDCGPTTSTTATGSSKATESRAKTVKAATLGDLKAIMRLASMNRDAQGGPQDLVAAHILFNHAALVIAEADAMRRALERCMTPGQLRQARVEAFRWKEYVK